MLTVSFHFGVPGLWVRTELLGAEFDVAQDGYRCRLVFPKDRNSFGLKDQDEGPVSGSVSGVTDGEPRLAAEVQIVQVKLELDTDIDAEDIPRGGPHDEEKFKELHGLLQVAVEAARSVVIQLVRRTRTDLGQWWLSPQFHSAPDGLDH